MGFTKLDDKIVFSSLMAEDDSVFKVWIIILSLTRSDGICPISEAFLARITGKHGAEISRCVGVLESPDKHSRSIENDGRRIERVDGGYRVLNYGKYRERSVREYETEKKRETREKNKKTQDVHGQSCTVHGLSASASASSSGSVSESVDLPLSHRPLVVPGCGSELKEAIDGWIESRRKMRKPPTQRAVNLGFKKVMSLSSGVESVAVEIVNQTVESGWSGFFPLRTDGKQRKQYGREEVDMNRVVDTLRKVGEESGVL